jgi:hypothetical protein
MGIGLTYPGAPARINSDGTAVEIHRFLKSPTLIGRAVFDVVRERFIADYLLTGRYNAVGGAIVFENGDEVVYAQDDPTAVAPGAEYDLTTFGEGTIAIARTQKYGRDAYVTDEAISRLLFDPARRAFTQLGNSTIRQVDRAALATIASRVTASKAASGPWVPQDDSEIAQSLAAKRIVRDVLRIKAEKEEENVGFDYVYDTAVLKPTQHALIVAEFINSGLLPREDTSLIATGVVEGILGLNWATSTHVPFTDPFFVDRDSLGGMAEENIESPGYARVGNIGMQTKTIRDEERDRYRLRTRRTTVPVVLDGKAGYRITGTGL